jgi:hypothetical protein
MDIQKQIEEWGKTQWSKLEYVELESKKKIFITGLKKFKEENQTVLQQLKDYVNEFLKIFPIVEKLKSNSNFKETHWTRLTTEIGLNPSDYNFKTHTFLEVIKMNL